MSKRYSLYEFLVQVGWVITMSAKWIKTISLWWLDVAFRWCASRKVSNSDSLVTSVLVNLILILLIKYIITEASVQFTMTSTVWTEGRVVTLWVPQSQHAFVRKCTEGWDMRNTCSGIDISLGVVKPISRFPRMQAKMFHWWFTQVENDSTMLSKNLHKWSWNYIWNIKASTSEKLAGSFGKCYHNSSLYLVLHNFQALPIGQCSSRSRAINGAIPQTNN